MLNDKAKEILEKVAQHIEEEPRRLKMEVWAKQVPKDVSPCGTVACIAGWVCILNGGNVSELEEIGYPFLARKILGLNYDQTVNLFYTHNWPRPFDSDYLDTTDPKEEAKITAARIRHFIANEGEEE